jgi:hypothetical protein
MKKVSHVELPNLQDVTFAMVLQICYALCPLTYEEIAERMGKGRETIYRYFTDPAYNPPSHLIPKLCTVMGNYLLIEWQAAQVNGQVIFSEVHCDEAHLQHKIGQLTLEASHVLMEASHAMMDGFNDPERLALLEKELDELTRKGQETKAVVRHMRADQL